MADEEAKQRPPRSRSTPGKLRKPRWRPLWHRGQALQRFRSSNLHCKLLSDAGVRGHVDSQEHNSEPGLVAFPSPGSHSHIIAPAGCFFTVDFSSDTDASLYLHLTITASSSPKGNDAAAAVLPRQVSALTGDMLAY